MPEAQAYLKRINVQFLDTYNFFDKEGHEHAVMQSDRIYNFCKPFLKIEDDIGIKEGYSNSFLMYLRCYVHYLIWLIEVIEKICIQFDIKKVITFYRDNRHMAAPFLSSTEGYAAEIGSKVAEKLNIDFEPLRPAKTFKFLFFRRLVAYIEEAGKFFIYKVKIALLKYFIKGKKIILTTSRAYNLGRVLDEFKKQFDNAHIISLNNKKGRSLYKFLSALFSIEIIQLPTIGISKRKKFFYRNLRDIVSALEASSTCEDVFIFRGVAFKCLVFRRILEDIIPVLCETYCQSLHLDGFFKKYQPAIVISQMARGINYNLGELASLYRIPSLLISHGSHVPPENKYEMIEWKEHGLGLINTHYQYIAIQSPWAKAYVDKIPVMSKQIITGPLLFAKANKAKDKEELLREKNILEHKDKIILLHADTPRLRGSFRFYVYPTVDEYIAGLNFLVKAVEKVKDIYLIIRFRPKYYLSKEQLTTLLNKSDCYSIHTDGSFEDYLSLSDILISYSSTTIEEALQNNVPVMLYDLHEKYCHIKGTEVLNSKYNAKINSCYYIGSERDIEGSLNWLKRNHFSVKEPALNWGKHIFQDNEKIELVSYFRNLF
jgi:hypothetical protein